MEKKKNPEYNKNTKNNGLLYFHLFAEKKKIHGEAMTECNTE